MRATMNEKNPLAFCRERKRARRGARGVVSETSTWSPGATRLLRSLRKAANFWLSACTTIVSGAKLPEAMRLDGVRAISSKYALSEEAPEEFTQLRPAVVVKGKEYETGKTPSRR